MKEINYTILIFVLIPILCVISNCHTLELDPEKLALIESVINDKFIPTNKVPGMSLSIIQNGEIILSKGYGKMNIEESLDARNDTLFSIASITKSFIATLVVKTLSEKYPTLGEMALDVPIVSFKLNFNFTFSDRYRAEQISFRDLLSHRTCLNDPGIQLLFSTMTSAQDYNYRTRYKSEVCSFRTKFHYNNALYALAGELIANLAEDSIENLVRNFMIEIGMVNSTTIDTSFSYEDLPNMSQGYYRKDDLIQKFNITLLRRNDIALGAGGILSTSTDMANYMNFHLNKGKVGDKQVVSEEALSWLYKSSISIGTLPDKQSENDSVTGSYAYGLGFLLSLYNGYTTVGHNGYWPPFNSDLTLYPSKNIGIFLVTNGPGLIQSNISHAIVGAMIFDILTSKTPTNIYLIKHLKKSSSLFHPLLDGSKMKNLIQFDVLKKLDESSNFTLEKKTATTCTKIEFENIIGIYGEKLAGDLMISLDDQDKNYLQINFGEWGIGRLLPINDSETIFDVDWKTDILQNFYSYPNEILNPVMNQSTC